MTLPDPLQNFWDDQQSIIKTLYGSGEVSLAQTAQNIFAKSLILTAASFFENETKNLVVSALSTRANNDDYVIAFCRRRGIERQFHTWFDWDKGNANAFFSMFGENAKIKSLDALKSNQKYATSIIDL